MAAPAPKTSPVWRVAGRIEAVAIASFRRFSIVAVAACNDTEQRYIRRIPVVGEESDAAERISHGERCG